MSIKSLYQEYQREEAEHKALALVKEKEREKARAFRDWQKMKRSKEREETASKRAERETELAAQRSLEREAELRRTEASAALRRERLASIGQTMRPVTRTVELGGTALKTVAHEGGKILQRVAHPPGATKYYVLAYRPNTDSPSYNTLEQAFEGQPFTVVQAVELIATSRQISYNDAYNRLKLMKQYGLIREGV